MSALRIAAYAVPGCHPDAIVRQLDGLTRGDRRPASWWLARAQDWLEAASDLPEGHRLYILWGGYAVALLAWWRVVKRYEGACAAARTLRSTEAPGWADVAYGCQEEDSVTRGVAGRRLPIRPMWAQAMEGMDVDHLFGGVP